MTRRTAPVCRGAASGCSPGSSPCWWWGSRSRVGVLVRRDAAFAMMVRMPRTPRSLLLALVLAALLVPTAAVGAESEKVSEISDSRIEESSGLVVSAEHDDLAYTVNDAGNDPIVYAVKISTGEVVGTTQVGGGDVEDSESIAIDGKGRMWLADLGDNDEERDDTALYSFAEPGPGIHSVNAKRFPVSYDGGAVDIEAFLVHPKTGKKFLVSKEKKQAGTLYSLPAKLKPTGNSATDTGRAMPEDTSDGTFTIDGSQALIRTRESVFLYDPKGWKQVDEIAVPEVEQGETIAMEPGGTSFLIGSEGENSPLIRVAYGPDATASDPPPAEQEPAAEEPADEPEEEGATIPVYLVVASVAVVILALVAIWVARRRQSTARH